MSKKIFFVLFYYACLLQAAEKKQRTPIQSLDQARQIVKEEKQKQKQKPVIYNRDQNPHIATYRSGPRVHGDPHQQNTKEKK